MEGNRDAQYTLDGMTYQGVVNGMANSIELVLTDILARLDVKVSSHSMLGVKIRALDKNHDAWSAVYAGDAAGLIRRLDDFNEIWNITKHGMLLGGVAELSFVKDMRVHEFSQARRDAIGSCFTLIMQELTTIHEAFPPNHDTQLKWNS